jgi:hypothetical protein
MAKVMAISSISRDIGVDREVPHILLLQVAA